LLEAQLPLGEGILCNCRVCDKMWLAEAIHPYANYGGIVLATPLLIASKQRGFYFGAVKTKKTTTKIY